VLVVLHVSPDGSSHLPTILERSGPLPAEHAEDGSAIAAGRILVAPPDRHLLVDDGVVRVVRGPRENFHRPSVDVLFRSAALARGDSVMAIVLSGALDDGVSGMRAVRALGGRTVVQSPDDAVVQSMPASVIAAFEPDNVMPADEIGRCVPALLAAGPPPRGHVDRGLRARVEQEVRMAKMERGAYEEEPPGDSSPFGCPECGGVLWENRDDGDPRYRCRIGHAYTARALLAAEEQGVEEALWAGLRALEEQESLARRMLDRPWTRDSAMRRRLRERARLSHERAETLRKFLAGPASASVQSDDSPELMPASEAAAGRGA
jgi:two-component system chemotaxis response regulator CheB